MAALRWLFVCNISTFHTLALLLFKIRGNLSSSLLYPHTFKWFQLHYHFLALYFIFYTQHVPLDLCWCSFWLTEVNRLNLKSTFCFYSLHVQFLFFLHLYFSGIIKKAIFFYLWQKNNNIRLKTKKWIEYWTKNRTNCECNKLFTLSIPLLEIILQCSKLFT